MGKTSWNCLTHLGYFGALFSLQPRRLYRTFFPHTLMCFLTSSTRINNGVPGQSIRAAAFCTWRIIPFSKWLITMVSFRFFGVIPHPNGPTLWLINGGDPNYLPNEAQWIPTWYKVCMECIIKVTIPRGPPPFSLWFTIPGMILSGSSYDRIGIQSGKATQAMWIFLLTSWFATTKNREKIWNYTSNNVYRLYTTWIGNVGAYIYCNCVYVYVQRISI